MEPTYFKVPTQVFWKLFEVCKSLKYSSGNWLFVSNRKNLKQVIVVILCIFIHKIAK